MATPFAQIPHVDTEIENVDIEDRFRQDLGDLGRLAQSIKDRGLISPIAVCENPEGSEHKYRLLAGGRRTAAIKYLIEKDKLPSIVTCRIYPEGLSELEVRCLEYAENMYRKDLTWNEQTALRDEIHNLQVKLHGPKLSTSPNAPGHSQEDTARMLGITGGQLSRDLELADLMKELPGIDWGKIESKQDAVKMIKNAKRDVHTQFEAQKATKKLGKGESWQNKLIDAYHIEDFFTGVEKIGANTIDMVELDPPYAIDLEAQKKDFKSSGYSYNEIEGSVYKEFMGKVIHQCFRVMKPHSWLICWFGPDPWFEMIYKTLIDAGFKTSRKVGIWMKGGGQTMSPEFNLANSYEMFFYARKGNPKIVKMGRSNVFSYPPVPPGQKIHPTERPVEMIQDLLETFTSPNSNVLVPFAGSGNTLLAAAKNLMMPIGFDLEKQFKDGYIVRVAREVK